MMQVVFHLKSAHKINSGIAGSSSTTAADLYNPWLTSRFFEGDATKGSSFHCLEHQLLAAQTEQ